MWLRLLRSHGHRTGHAVFRFPFLDLRVQRYLSDFSTVRSLLTPSMLSEKETHRVSAAAIVPGVLQQATVVRTSNLSKRILSASRGDLNLVHNTQAVTITAFARHPSQNHSSSQHCQQKLAEIAEAEARPQKIAAAE